MVKFLNFLKRGWGSDFFSSNPYKKTNLKENVGWCIFSKLEVSLLSSTSSPAISHGRVIEIEKCRDFSPFSSSSKKLVKWSIVSAYLWITIYLPTTWDSWLQKYYVVASLISTMLPLKVRLLLDSIDTMFTIFLSIQLYFCILFFTIHSVKK